MKIVAIDARESGSSTGRYIDKLIEHLHKLKTDYNFVVLTKPHRVEYISKIAPGFKVISCDIKEFTFSEQLKLLNKLHSIKPDLVHFGMTQQPVLYEGKSVTTIHDLTMVWEKNLARNPVVHKIKQTVYRQVIKKAAKKSVFIITPSKFVKDDLIKFSGQPSSKIVVTYEAADKIKDSAEPFKDLVGKEFLMYVGRPSEHKNLERLIEAFSSLASKYPELYLALAGKKDSNYQRIEQMVKRRELKNVIFTDFISEGQLRWMFENCAAYIFPSLSEGFGLPGLEAMVQGAPVISSNTTCLPEIYGDAAEYFDPLDLNDMARAISKVLVNSSLRDELIKKGYKQVSGYSWQRMANQTLEVYKKALDS